MHFVVQSGQQQGPSNRINNSEYEIRTFNRARSPVEPYSNNYRRSPARGFEQGTSESGLGEMIYIEPNENNFRRNQNMSPLNDSRNILMRSPGAQPVRTDTRGGVINMSQQMNFTQMPRIQQTNIEIESRKDRFSRSPKTINLGESLQDVDYNIRTLNRTGKEPKLSNSNSPKGNFAADRSYNMMSNETGNIFLDPPMQQQSGTYAQHSEPFNSSTGFQGSYEKKSPIEGQQYQSDAQIYQQYDNQFYQQDQNSREIQFAMNPRDYQEPVQGILRKISPKANVEGDSDSGSEKNDNVNQIKDLKTQLDRSNHVAFRPDDGMTETRPMRNDMERMEEIVRQREDNVTGEDVKKLLKYYVKTYDPNKGEDGNLISNKQTIIQSSNDQLFNDRYKVLQKMNKLSSILLAKNRNTSETGGTLNRSYGDIDNNTKFNKSTLDAAVVGSRRTIRPQRKNKFLYVSLAMLSARGPNAEDRTILRRMRLDKGGVVDLAQEGTKNKNKYKIVKSRVAGRGYTTINPKYREKAARIVQAWWRERKEKYKKILDQIVKIQSVWRGKFTRKYVYDIIYISYLQEKFFAIMRNVLVNHVRPYVFNQLFSKKKLIKDTLGNLLDKNDLRYTMLRLRPYFMKWYEISQLLKMRTDRARDLVRKKELNESDLGLLKKYFDQWALRANLEKYIGKAKDAEDKKQKFFGVLSMVNGLNNLSKRQVYHNTKEPIANYLRNMLKKKILDKAINDAEKRNQETMLRDAVHKWKDQMHRYRMRELRHTVCKNIIERTDSRIDKIILKRFFDRWRRECPKSRALLQINEGAEILQRFVFRATYSDPLNCFSEKLDIENMKYMLMKLLRIKARNVRDKLRDYFNRWRNKATRLKDKSGRGDIYKTLLKNIIDATERRILAKRFYQWRQRPKEDLNEKMRRITKFTETVKEVMKSNLKPEKADFFDRFKKTRSERAIREALEKLLRNYRNKNQRLLRYYFYKWRSQVKNSEMRDLHLQLMKYLVQNTEGKYNRNLLGKYFARWRLFTVAGKAYDNLDKLKQVYKGGDILDNLHKRRIRDLIIRLYRKMGKDYRPVIIRKIVERIEKPKTTLREAFDRWRRITEKEKAAKNLSNIKGKFIEINTRYIKNRTDRDKLLKAWYRWKAACFRKDDYYPNMLKGFNLLTSYSKKKACEEPYDRISVYKNFTRKLIKVIHNYENQTSRNLQGKLRNLLGRWRKLASKENVQILKSSIIYKIRKSLAEKENLLLLTKYFTRWKLYRKKGLDVNFAKGLEKLTDIYKRPYRPDVVDAFRTKINRVCREKGTEGLFKGADRILKSHIREALLKILKKSYTFDPNRKNKIKIRLRRLIKKQEAAPLARAFLKWQTKVLQMNIKEKDMERVDAILANRLRFNDRLNLNGAMNRWKKQIQRMKEQYLKSLLVKQIKTSQTVKEQMDNKSRLRAALLRWRNNLIPMDYLDRVRQIRKGCKLFKLGLKKMHERDIFDNLGKLARENGKKILLLKLLKEVIPEFNKYHIKRCIETWKSKLGDTDRMKNKMKNLLEDYVFSDRVHDGLFKQNKNDLIEALKYQYNLRKDAADKIRNFVNKIQDLPQDLEKLKRVVIINKILKTKNRNLKDILHSYLIRYYRQTQKIKNDENSKIIQKFVRYKIKKLFDRNELVQKGVNAFAKYIKKRCFFRLKDESDNYAKNKALKDIIKRIEDQKLKILRQKFIEWRDKLPLLKKIDAITKLQNMIRNFIARKKLNSLKQRIVKIKLIIERNKKKDKNLLNYFLHHWLNKVLKIKNDENAKIIQLFCRRNLIEQQKNKSQNDLKNLFNKAVKHQLSTVMEKSSHILGGKGEVLYKTLIELFYKKPFDDLINNLKFKTRLLILKKIQPKIHEKLYKYFIPLALQKWKHNTYDQTVKYTKILQDFLRNQYEKKQQIDKMRREEIILEFFTKLQKINKYQLQLPFTIWSKKVKLMKLTEEVEKIQRAWRAYLARKRAKDLKVQQKYRDLSKKLLAKQLVVCLKRAGEKNTSNKLRKQILYKILKEKIYIDDKSSLGVFFDKWKRYVKKVHDSATIIQNMFRRYKAIKEKNRLKRIRDLLRNYVNKHIKSDIDRLRSKLRKWKWIVGQIKCDENSKIIQKFIKAKLYRILNDKIKNLFINGAHNRVSHLINLNAKMNKMQRALFRPSLQRFMNNLKRVARDKRIADILRKRLGESNEQYKLLLIKKYLRGWKDKTDRLKEKMDDSALRIQRAFRMYLAKKKREKLQKIRDLLLRFVIKKNNISNNKLYSAFTKWLNKVRAMICDKNARIIQEFCRIIQQKLADEKEFKRRKQIESGLEKLINARIGCRGALEKIISQYKRIIFTKFNDDLKKHRLDTLKDVFDRIKKYAFYKKLISVIGIPENLKRRILKKTIETWKDNAGKLARKRAIELIIKNIKIYLKNKKLRNRKDILKNIMQNLINKYSDIKQVYLKKWNDIAQKLKTQSAKRRAVEYLAKRYKISEARKRWNKLKNKLLLKNRNKDLFDVVNRIILKRKLEKFMKPFPKIARRTVIKKIETKRKIDDIRRNLGKLFPKLSNLNDQRLIRRYMKKWKENVDKLRNREDRLLKAMDTLDHKKIKNDIIVMSRVSILKKLFHDIPRIRALEFIKRLKRIKDEKEKFEKLSKDLDNGKKTVDVEHKKKVMNRLYKLFFYKKLANMIKNIQNLDKKIQRANMKELLLKLLAIKNSHSEYNYGDKAESTNKASLTKFKFTKKISKPENKIIEDKNGPLKKVLPAFVNYLQAKINATNKDSMNHIVDYYRAMKFCKLLKSWSNARNKNPKKDFVDTMKREMYILETRPLYQLKLFKLFRKKYIRTITTTLLEPSRLYKLFYLINITKMHKNIAKQRFFRELIRKWRFISFSKKMARKKLELMYKNLHASYMQMADEIFGDDEVNPSVIKEFERFGTDVGMFTGQETEVEEEINKKYYQAVDKKYVFTARKSVQFEPTIKKKVMVETEEEIIEETQEGKGPKKSVDQNFEDIKKKGFSSKYFKSGKDDKDKKEDEK